MIACVLCGCSVRCNVEAAEPKTQTVRVTYYWTGSKTATGSKPQHLKTCAVDPKLFKYGTHIEIPKLGITVKANDTGPAVVRKTAARAHGKNVPVIDVYVSSYSEAQRLIKKHGMFMEIKTK